MINSSTKLQNQFLGKDSPLSENSKSQLFNAINSRSMDRIAKPIGKAIVEYGAAELAGPWVGKVFGKLLERFAARNAVTAASKGEELFIFNTKAAEHMEEKGRAVPVQILKKAINISKGMAAPRGSRALIHTTKMWKNGKAYNLEVLYDKTTNSI